MADPDNTPAPTTASLNAFLGEIAIKSHVLIFYKPPPEHPIYSAVGRVAAEWALLEHRLDEIIWQLIGCDNSHAACLTSQMIGHFPRFNTIIALLSARQLPQELTDLIKKESGRVSELAEKRARAVHDAWYISSEDGGTHQFRSRPRGGLEFGIKQNEVDNLDSLTKQITARIDSINKLLTAINAALFSSPNKSP